MVKSTSVFPVIIILSTYTYHEKKMQWKPLYLTGRKQKSRELTSVLACDLYLDLIIFFETKTCFESCMIKAGGNEPAHL